VAPSSFASSAPVHLRQVAGFCPKCFRHVPPSSRRYFRVNPSAPPPSFHPPLSSRQGCVFHVRAALALKGFSSRVKLTGSSLTCFSTRFLFFPPPLCVVVSLPCFVRKSPQTFYLRKQISTDDVGLVGRFRFRGSAPHRRDGLGVHHQCGPNWGFGSSCRRIFFGFLNGGRLFRRRSLADLVVCISQPSLFTHHGPFRNVSPSLSPLLSPTAGWRP